MSTKILLAAGGLAALVAGAALASSHGMSGMTGHGDAQGGGMAGMMEHGGHGDGMAGHDGQGAAEGSQVAPSTAAYRAANDAMHAAMDIAYTGDADVDFARGMIGHHQGAIDMAQVVLAHGDDPEMRTLAQAIIAAQSAEIAQLQAWIAANGR